MPSQRRLVLFPIKYHEVSELYISARLDRRYTDLEHVQKSRGIFLDC